MSGTYTNGNLPFSPTGYHLLYADLTNKMYIIDPRAYLLGFTPISMYTERDVEWLELIGDFPLAKTRTDSMLLIHRYVSDGRLAASPDLELIVRDMRRPLVVEIIISWK